MRDRRATARAAAFDPFATPRGIIAIALSASVIACGDAGVQKRSTAPARGAAADPAATGAQLFERNDCGGCHEQAAIPGMVVRPLGGLSARFSADSLRAFLANPPEPMPKPMLSDGERHQLAVYLLNKYP